MLMATIKPNTNKFSLSWKVYDLIKQTGRAGTGTTGCSNYLLLICQPALWHILYANTGGQ